MKYKKGLIFICLIICLFSIASVCASEVNDTVVASDGRSDEILTVEDNNDFVTYDNQVNGENMSVDSSVDEIGATEENELSATPGTFTDLANDIANAGDELNLTKDYIYSDNDSNYRNGIIIDKKIIINGNGHSIDGNNRAKTFKISFYEVILKNISFRFSSDKSNYYYSLTNSSYGGAIEWIGENGSIINCSFINCSYGGYRQNSPYGGGAIYWAGSNGSLLECSFINCYNSRSATSGGAIYWVGSMGYLSDCSFINCSSMRRGGAIHWEANKGVLTNCSFENCSVLGSLAYDLCCGGAISLNSESTNISNCNFNNCYSTSYSSREENDYLSSGGAIYSRGGVLSNCSFINCFSSTISKQSNVYSLFSNGGAIMTSSMDIINSNFINCSAFINSEFSISEFAVTGGAIETGGNLINCNFVNCSTYGLIKDTKYSCKSYGGAVHSNCVNKTLSNCSFINCSSLNQNKSTISCFGGAIYMEYYNSTLYNCSFINCFSSVDGGAIYIRAYNSYYYRYYNSILNCSFFNCSADGKGGAIFESTSDDYHYNAFLINCSFVNCSTFNEGGAVYLMGHNNVSNSCFVNCSASSNGGVIYLIGSKNILSNCNFINCSLSSSSQCMGGVIYWSGSQGTLLNCNFTYCNISSSSSSYLSCKGGVIYWSGSQGTLLNCNFTYCNSFSEYLDGGTIYWSGLNGVLSNSNFINSNSSPHHSHGGSVYWYGANGVLSNSSFINCLVSSKYYSYGAGVYWYGANGVLLNSSFVNCSVYSSSGIYYSKGGAIYWEGSNGNISKCNFEKNIAKNQGNDIYWVNDDGEITLVNCIFNGNNETNKHSVYLTNALDPNINIDFKNITIGEDQNINISMNPGGKGNITVQIGFITNIIAYHKTFKFPANETINITIPNLIISTYSIHVYYWPESIFYKEIELGSSNYDSFSSKTIWFKVSKVNPVMNVSVDDVEAGEDAIFKVNLNKNATGEVKIKILNQIFSNNIKNGTAIIKIPNIIGGVHNYTVSYLGNSNYSSVSLNGVLHVNYTASNISYNITNITYLDDLVIHPNITNGTSGNISVYINNIFKTNISVGEDLILSNLTAGNYTIKLYYNGDDYYDSCECSKNFTVFKKDTCITIPSLETFINNTYGDLIILNPLISGVVDGNIKVYIDDNYQKTINLNENIKLENLNAGVHVIKLIFSGNDNFNPCTNPFEINIIKSNTTINISIENISDSNDILMKCVLHDNTTGNISLNINNGNYSVKLVKGVADIIIPNLPANKYNYTINYFGDQNFNQYFLIGTLEIKLKQSNINLTSEDIYVDDIMNIGYDISKLTTGVLSVYVNDIFVKNVTVGDKIELENLAFGNYTVKVIYNGDDYFDYCQNTTTFEVHKLNPTLTLSANNISSANYKYFNTHITAGNDVNIIFIFNEDAIGEVNITHEFGIGHEANYTLELVNGKVNITIPNVMADSHYFTISYSGDDKYLPFNGESEVYFNYKQSSIDYTIPSNLLWGDSFIINPVLPDDATGEIEITIYDNNGYYVNDFINVGSLYNFTILNGDTNYLKLYYPGDEYYDDYNYLREFNVAKLNTTLSITDKMEVNNLVPIKVTLNEDATGNIRIYMGDKWNYGKLNNGECIFNVSDLIGTVYNVNIVYDGDSKYNSINVFKSVNITRKKLNHTFNIHNIIYGEDMNLVHTSSASTIVDFYIDGVYKQTVNAGFTYTIEKPSIGEHELRVVFNGNNYYEPYDDTTRFWVFQKYPIDSEDTYILYNSGNYFKARFYDEYGSPLVNEYVGFSVNGKDEARQTDNEGWATFDIDLKPGVYNVTSINLQYNEKTVNKLTVFTSIGSQDLIRAYNSGIDFNATFLNKNAKALANTPIIFNVNGEDYFVTTNMDGQAVLNVPLKVGTYTIITINTATKENKTNTLTIVPSVQANDMIRAYNSTMDYKATFLDVDGNYLSNHLVSFKIGETTYESTTDNKGVAVLNVPLNVGEYNITAINPITSENSIKKLTILPRIIENSDMITDTDCEDYFAVRIIDDDGRVVRSGQTVTFIFNNTVSNVKTDAQGYAKLLIPLLNKGKYPITVTYKGFTASNNIFVYKNLESIITIDVNDIDYNQNLKLNVSVIPEYRHGNLTIDITGTNGFNVEYNTTANKVFTKELTGLNVSDYVVAVRFIDMDNYFISQNVAVFEVSKIDPNVIVVVYGAEYSQNATITVNIPQASGNVTIKIGDKRTYTEFIPEDGVIVKRINDLNIGEYDVTVTYNGNDNYNPLTKTAKMNITKISSYVWLNSLDEFDYGQDIIINLTASVEGSVRVQFDEEVQTVNVRANELYQLKYHDYEAGHVYSVEATLTPSNSNYDISTDDLYIEILPVAPNLYVYAYDIELNQPTNITVIVDNKVNGIVRLELDKKNYTETINDGKAIFNIVALKLGNYTVYAYFDGNVNYTEDYDYDSFEVTKINSQNIEIPQNIVNNDNTLSFNLASDATGKVIITIDKKNYTGDVINGKVNIDLPDLSDGEYDYIITYSGDNQYSSFTNTGKITINKVIPTVKANNMTVTYGSGYDFIATFFKADGSVLANSYVVFNVNGNDNVVKTDSNGIAVLNIGLGNGVYNIVSNNLITGESVTNTLTIIGEPAPLIKTTILVSPVTTVYNGGKYLVVTLKDSNGKAINGVKVTVVFSNGKTETPTTDNNGQIKVSTNGLVPVKTYAATITFAGNNKYVKSTASVAVTVNKATPKIIAKAKTFKKSIKTKKYSITLKNNLNKVMKGTKVTIKVNKKTYTAKTNSKGVATFKIKKLTKKGTFKSTVTYKGDKYYNKVTKTVKIKVK